VQGSFLQLKDQPNAVEKIKHNCRRNRKQKGNRNPRKRMNETKLKQRKKKVECRERKKLFILF